MTVTAETAIALPSKISKKRSTCWKVFNVLRLMVFRPASVMAETTRKTASMKRTLRKGVAEAQKMMEAIVHVDRKYR